VAPGSCARRSDEHSLGPHLAPIRQRIESIFCTCKDLPTLERHSGPQPRPDCANASSRGSAAWPLSLPSTTDSDESGGALVNYCV
jgi:hypothetical protein